jgi:undecaprenyl-diphosphatase
MKNLTTNQNHKLMAQFTRWWKALGPQELTVLVTLVLALAGIWGFVELADEVNEGETWRVDEVLLLALRNPADPADPLGPIWFEEMMRDVTALGGGALLLLFTATVTGYLLIQRQYGLALLLVLTVSGAMLLNMALKENFNRPRPDLVPHGMSVRYASFPSGHSMGAAATYLTMGALLARAQRRRRLKLYFLGLAIFFTGAVGLSRVYLGVHWPTDVLAGWTAGASWALLCWLSARTVQRWLQTHRPPQPESPLQQPETWGAES